MIIIATIAVYFCILLLISLLTGRKADNETFFRANGKSPWYLVAFGMIGASISGVTFVSVPGMTLTSDMTYMQTCLGFIVGYFVVAYLLLPVYYRLRLSKMASAAVRFYVVCMILQQFVLDKYAIPFPVTVVVLVALIWLYTRRGGIRTLVLTDTFQTLCMLLALLLIIYKVVDVLGLNLPQAVQAIAADSHSRIFVLDDWVSTQNFWKQFLSGIFIVIVMTGLDQDMMQKNLTCKTLCEAQKDMCSYGFAFAPVNLLFLALGILLMMYYHKTGQALPAVSDDLMLQVIAGGQLGTWVVILFTIGIVAACFSSADSALTALTTTFCVDICNQRKDERLRKWSHLGVSVVFVLFILIFRYVNSTSLIDAVYTIVSYTYGPLLGLFAFGLSTKRKVNDRYAPFIAIASPLLCFALDMIVSNATGYKFGYELLMLNGLLTYVGLWVNKAHLLSKK